MDIKTHIPVTVIRHHNCINELTCNLTCFCQFISICLCFFMHSLNHLVVWTVSALTDHSRGIVFRIALFIVYSLLFIDQPVIYNILQSYESGTNKAFTISYWHWDTSVHLCFSLISLWFLLLLVCKCRSDDFPCLCKALETELPMCLK